MDKSTQLPVYDSASRGSAPLEELRSILKYRHLVVQFVRRDILTRYKRSVLGVGWTMLNPLGMMIILTIVFSRVFGRGQPGYAAYVLSGLVAWNFFAQSTYAASIQLVWGGGLLKKIYIPRTVFAVSSTGTGLVNLVISLVPLFFVLLVTGVQITPAIIFLPIPILFLAMFGLGLGLLISTIAVYFTDVVEMYQIALVAWMYLTPIIYPIEIVPEPYRSWIVHFNPMYHLISLFRAPIYDGRVPSMHEITISGGIALVTLLVGWFVFSENSDEFAYRV